MKQQALGAGGTLKSQTVSSAHEKLKKSVPKKKLNGSDMKTTWLNPKPAPDNIEKPEDQEDFKFKQRAPVYTHDEALNAYLKTVDTEGDFCTDQAREFLMRGPPFRGIHDKQYKASIKEAGLQWLKNPDFVEGEWGTGQRFGWYVAHDIKELKAVLSMARKVDGERAWSPCDMDEIATRAVNELMDQHAEVKRKKDDEMRVAEEERRKAKEQALGRGSGMQQADLPHDIQAIAEYMAVGGYPDWKYDRELIASSAACAALGPITPTHAIRVRRGLRFNIITPKQVHLGQWDSDAVIAMRKRENAVTLASKRHREAMNMEQEEESKLKALKKKAETATRVLKRDDEMEVVEDNSMTSADAASGVKYYPMKDTALRLTECAACKTIIHEQFMDCGCIARWWKKCEDCLQAYSDVQRCRCNAVATELALPPVDDDRPVDAPLDREIDKEQDQMREGFESDKLRVAEEGEMSAKQKGKQRAVRWEDE